MNKALLTGRLTKDPEVRYSTANDRTMAISRFTLAVNRKGARQENGGQQTDYINCVAFDHMGEFVEKYLKKGTKIFVLGRIQTGSYEKKDGSGKVYTTDIVVEEIEFAESRQASESQNNDNSGYRNPADNQSYNGCQFNGNTQHTDAKNQQPRRSNQANQGSNQNARNQPDASRNQYYGTGRNSYGNYHNTKQNAYQANRGYSDDFMDVPDDDDGLPFN